MEFGIAGGVKDGIDDNGVSKEKRFGGCVQGGVRGGPLGEEDGSIPVHQLGRGHPLPRAGRSR